MSVLKAYVKGAAKGLPSVVWMLRKQWQAAIMGGSSVGQLLVNVKDFIRRHTAAQARHRASCNSALVIYRWGAHLACAVQCVRKGRSHVVCVREMWMGGLGACACEDYQISSLGLLVWSITLAGCASEGADRGKCICRS